MCRKEAEDAELGRRESIVLSSPDSLFKTPQAGGKCSGIGISLRSVARDPRELKRADRVAEVKADVGAARREIDVEPRGSAEVSAEPSDAHELARGLGVVTALLVRERSRRVRGGAAGRLLEVCFGNQPRGFDRPSLHISPMAQLGGREALHISDSCAPGGAYPERMKMLSAALVDVGSAWCR